jgi:hypothetical protein
VSRGNPKPGRRRRKREAITRARQALQLERARFRAAPGYADLMQLLREMGHFKGPVRGPIVDLDLREALGASSVGGSNG